MWLLEHTSGEDCNNGDGGVNTADGPSSEIPSDTFGPALNETGHQDENIGSAAHKGDEEASEDDWLEREESAEDWHTRYANSLMEEVSDPEGWMEMHYPEPEDLGNMRDRLRECHNFWSDEYQEAIDRGDHEHAEHATREMEHLDNLMTVIWVDSEVASNNCWIHTYRGKNQN